MRIFFYVTLFLFEFFSNFTDIESEKYLFPVLWGALYTLTMIFFICSWLISPGYLDKQKE